MRRLLSVALALGFAAPVTGAYAAELLGTERADALTGTREADSLYGRGGDDVLRGEGGNDDLDGGPGADDLNGGSGQDAASYSGTAAVLVILDDRANDGSAGEHDNVRSDVESVYGGAGNDALTGNGRTNALDGGAGADTLTGGRGRDFLFGGEGDDQVNARDGAIDVVDCGPGSDRVDADGSDVVSGCELRGRVGPSASRRATGTIRNFWSWGRTVTLVNTLVIDDLTPSDVRVTVSCRGDGCPFRSRSYTGDRRVSLTGAFHGRRLGVGTRIEIRITASDAIGKYVRYRTRASKRPARRTACLLPGESAPSRC